MEFNHVSIPRRSCVQSFKTYDTIPYGTHTHIHIHMNPDTDRQTDRHTNTHTPKPRLMASRMTKIY